MLRYIPLAVIVFWGSFSVVLGQEPPSQLDPIRQVEYLGRQARRNVPAIPTGGPFTPVVLSISGRSVKDALKLLPTSTADLTPYQGLLKIKDTGVTRLLKESDCIIEKNGEKVVDTRCPQWMLPGGGEYYSFRRSGYSPRHLSDLGFIQDKFVIQGLFEQGVMVDLQDQDIQTVDTEHDAVRSLLSFKNASIVGEGEQLNRQLEAGVRIGDRVFRRSLPARAGATYLARFIAYRSPGRKGGVSKEVADVMKGDPRADIIVAFRVLALETDGSVTLIWKKLLSRPSSILELKEKNK